MTSYEKTFKIANEYSYQLLDLTWRLIGRPEWKHARIEEFNNDFGGGYRRVFVDGEVVLVEKKGYCSDGLNFKVTFYERYVVSQEGIKKIKASIDLLWPQGNRINEPVEVDIGEIEKPFKTLLLGGNPKYPLTEIKELFNREEVYVREARDNFIKVEVGDRCWEKEGNNLYEILDNPEPSSVPDEVKYAVFESLELESLLWGAHRKEILLLSALEFLAYDDLPQTRSGRIETYSKIFEEWKEAVVLYFLHHESSGIVSKEFKDSKGNIWRISEAEISWLFGKPYFTGRVIPWQLKKKISPEQVGDLFARKLLTEEISLS